MAIRFEAVSRRAHEHFLAEIDLNYISDAVVDVVLEEGCKKKAYNDLSVHSLVSERFRWFYKENRFTDVTLKAGNASIRAHKLVLAASSAFFEAQFSYQRNVDMVDEDEIELQCDGTILKDVLDYIYFGKILITPGNIFGLMEIQDFLQIASLRNLINHFIRRQMSESNDFLELFKLKQMCDYFRYRDLAADLFSYIRKNFFIIIPKKEFLEMPVELLCECLQSDYLVFGEEDDLLLGICRWMSADDTRIPVFEKLIAHVDASAVRRWSQTKAKALALVEGYSDVKSWLDGWFCGSEHTRLSSSSGGRSKYKTMMKPTLMSLGGVQGMNNHQPVSTVDCIVSWYSEKWKPMIPTVDHVHAQSVPVPLMLHPRIRPVVACNGTNVYVTGGGTNCSEMYNSQKNTWTPLPDVPSDVDTSLSAMAVLDDSLYLIAPISVEPTSSKSFRFMVLYEDSKNWHDLTAPDVKNTAVGTKTPCLVSSLSSLYFLTSGETYEEKLIWRYDVSFNLWSAVGVQPLVGYNHICSCIAFHHQIFIIFNNSILFSYNTITQQWRKKGDDLPDDQQGVSTRYNSFISTKLGCEIVLADELNTHNLQLFSLTGRKSTWLNRRRLYSGLGYFYLGLYNPPSH